MHISKHTNTKCYEVTLMTIGVTKHMAHNKVSEYYAGDTIYTESCTDYIVGADCASSKATQCKEGHECLYWAHPRN
jgi:hypothetical protein